jgi:hypothetical protein
MIILRSGQCPHLELIRQLFSITTLGTAATPSQFNGRLWQISTAENLNQLLEIFLTQTSPGIKPFSFKNET